MAINVDSTLNGDPDWVQQEKGSVYESIFAQISDFDLSFYNSASAGDYLSGLSAYHSSGYNFASRPYTYKNNLEFTSNMARGTSSGVCNFNITATLIDTLSSKLASVEILPQAVTDKGNVKGRELAENINYLIKGVFHNEDASGKMSQCMKHALINRVGYIKVEVDEDRDKIKFIPVFSDEVLIDNADGYYNCPSKMIHRTLVPKAVAKLMYPKFKDEIESTKETDSQQFNTRDYTPSVVIAEAWCKNTYTKKGRHVICIDNCDILDEEWDKDYFPILKLDYNKPVVGFLGQSMVDELRSLQKEMDLLVANIQAICKIMSQPRVFLDKNSDVNKNHFTSKLGSIILYDGKRGLPPQIHNGASLAPELFQFLDWILGQAYVRVGLSPLDNQGLSQPGTGNRSNEALKTEISQKNERWQMLIKIYEEKHIELAQLMLNELKGKKVKISSLDRTIGLKSIDSGVIPDTQDSYVLKVFPVSALPKSIPDLMDSCEKLYNLGLVNKSQLFDLLQLPDLDSKVSMISAPYKLIDKKLDNMLKTGKYWNPEPYYDLSYASIASMQLYNWCEYNEIEESKLKLLRRFINDVKKLTVSSMPPPAPAIQAPATNVPQPQVQ